MKKIDLHLHTKPSVHSDATFVFSLDKLEEYVSKLNIDCIAITNHNLFDLSQYQDICSRLKIKVFPGIEINLEKGHLLLISENDELEDFNSKCSRVESLITSRSECIIIQQLKDIFGDLSRYLLIPHYDKSPIISQDVIDQLKQFISAGEVTSAKKFKFYLKETESLVPVLFSDLRFKLDMLNFSPRQTFIDADDTSLRAVKTSLLSKDKVFYTLMKDIIFFKFLKTVSNYLQV